MDTSSLETQTAIAQLTALVGQREIELAFLKLALENLKQIYIPVSQELDAARATIVELSKPMDKPIGIALETATGTSTEAAIL